MALVWKRIAFVEDVAAQSVMGNPTGSSAVASAITVAEQTLVGRITGGNVDDLSVTQVKTLIGSSTTSATGVIELATQAEVLAGTDTSRAVVPIDLAARIAIDVNPKAMSQGVNMTYVASGSTGIAVADNDNIDFGTGNFTLVWEGMIPDYTPAADTILMQKTNGTNGWVLQVDTTGVLQVILNTTTYSSTINPALINTTAHKITAVVTRETASVAGSVVFYVDGIICGASVAITAGAPTTVNNAVSLYVMGTSAKRSAGLCYFASVFNRALSASEVLDLYRNGINYADKWGSQTPVYTSDFSAGVDGWLGAGVPDTALTGNTDSINGSDNWLKVERTAAGVGRADIYKSVFPAENKHVRATITIYNPAGSAINGIKISAAGATDASGVFAIAADQELTLTFDNPSVQTNGTGMFRVLPCVDGLTTSIPTGSIYYIKNFLCTQIGCTLALEPEGIQPSPGQWLDSSTNKLHAMQPATGSSLVRLKKEFEFRSTNVWTASSAAQYIGGLNQNILTSKHFITSIVSRAIVTTDVENFTIGDGSDADYYVTAITPTATPIIHTLAKNLNDGTNLKLVVTPAAEATMTIEFIVKGYLLE